MKTEEEIKKILTLKEQIEYNAALLNQEKKKLRNAHKENQPWGVVSFIHKSIIKLRKETRHLYIIYGEARSIPTDKIEKLCWEYPDKELLEKIREKYLYN